jgi:GDP-L-fucose synthase
VLGDTYDFLAPSYSELDLFDGGAVMEYLKKNTPDIVLHAATAGGNRKIADQTGVLQKNLTMFYNLCAGKEFFHRMIVLGSGAEYDKRTDIHLVKEEEFGRSIPVDEYGLAKYTMATLAENMDFVTHVRLFGVFGKYEDYQTRFISNAICKTLFGLPVTLKQNVFFDYVYIKDLVGILQFFIEKQPPKICYNVGTGKPVDLLKLANIVTTVGGTTQETKVVIEGLNKEYTCNTDRLKEYVGEYVFTPYEEAVKEMFEYYKGIQHTLHKDMFLQDV